MNCTHLVKPILVQAFPEHECHRLRTKHSLGICIRGFPVKDERQSDELVNRHDHQRVQVVVLGSPFDQALQKLAAPLKLLLCDLLCSTKSIRKTDSLSLQKVVGFTNAWLFMLSSMMRPMSMSCISNCCCMNELKQNFTEDVPSCHHHLSHHNMKNLS